MSKPSDSDIEKAIDVCEDLAAYIKETEPYARHDIATLEYVIETLSNFTGDYDE